MSLIIGSFPYSPGFNPYQELFTTAIENAGLQVTRIPPEKWFPLQKTNRVNCDVLHLDWPHDWYSGKNFATQQVKKWMYLHGLRSLKHRVVWTAHNLIAHDSKNENHEREMMQVLINRCDGIMVFSDAAKKQLVDCYTISPKTEIRKIYHGHYVDSYANDCDMSHARARLSVSNKEQLLVSVGSIKPYKGIESLIAMFEQHVINNVRWIIAGTSGNDEFRKKIAAMVRNANQRGCQIEFHDRLVPGDELQYYFNAADACLLPFESVLNSGSLLMAMSFGCPVIAPALGSIPEVASGEWSFLYDSNDHNSLLETISAAMVRVSGVDPVIIRNSVIDFVRQKYSWESVGLTLKDWYEHLCTPG